MSQKIGQPRELLQREGFAPYGRGQLHLPEGFPLILFSAEKGEGRGELLRLIEEHA